MKEKLPKIITLNPVVPLFDIRLESEKLNPNDAEVVHVIHISGSIFWVIWELAKFEFGRYAEISWKYISLKVQCLKTNLRLRSARVTS